MKKEVAMKRNQLRILRTLSLAFIALLCLSLPAYADMGPKPDLTVTVVNAPEGLCYVDLLYEGGGDDLHSDFDTSGCDQKLIASLHTLEGDGWTLALTTGISSGPPIFGDLTPNSDGPITTATTAYPAPFAWLWPPKKGSRPHRRAIPALGSTPTWSTTGTPTPCPMSPPPRCTIPPSS